MKKMIIAVMVMLTLVFAVGAVAEKQISLDEAKKAALDYAGVKAEDVTFVKAHLDRDDGRTVYEIEFFGADTKYELDVDAADGSIREFEKEMFSRDFATQKLTEEEAMKVALADAGFSAENVRVKKAKLDEEDGRLVYEIEFVAEGMEYEYEIDAQTCTITEKSVEKED
ncbi:MAG: PepSY domain-containing protein [Clostridia bacterium]|nr:PepSY domain-containing protein [Clostridia bacterium]